MATDAQRKELQDKVNRLVAARFGSDYDRAFGHYDRSKDGTISRDELLTLLVDAGIGSWLTRGIWADGILAELDADKDGKISKAEFQAILNQA
jgi:Ca2+-binding EF-hand superfamily protein